jgi:membrane fusion protein, multidrug efflux system
MSKKTVYALAGAGLILAVGLAWWVQQDRPKAEAAAAAPSAAGGRPAGAAPGGPGGMPAVEVATVSTVRLVDDAQAVGTLKSRQSVVLRPEVAGRIVRFGFEEGRPVRQGQLLVQLDDSLPRAELSQAQAQLSIAQANLQRNRELVSQNFVSRRVLDESQASLQVAQAQVQLAQARLARTQVLAPFAGIAGIRQVNLGDFVREGADLVNLEDLSLLMVDFRLPERYQARIQVGQNVDVMLDALPGQTLTAEVQAVDPQIDANGRSLLVRAAIQGPQTQGLRPGMFARVNVVLSVDEQAVVIPEEAVVPQGNRQTVLVVQRPAEGESTPPTVQRVQVELGIRRGAMVQVLKGLEPGQTVVVAGQQRLQRDGMPVRIVDLNSRRP